MSIDEERDLDAEARDAAHWAAVEEASEMLIGGDFERGLGTLRAIIERDRDNPYAFHFLGAALFDMKQFAAAHDAYVAALRVSPGYRASRVGLSHCLRLLGDQQAALDQANVILAEHGEDGDALYAAALALAAGGQREQSRALLERFLTTHPEIEVQLEVRGILDALSQADDAEPSDYRG
jgi:tetratricopeptide (TPR) repeat protein